MNRHTETAYFLKGPVEWILLDPTDLVNSCGRLKPDISKANYVINSGQSLMKTFKFTENGGQQCPVCHLLALINQSYCMR